MPEIRSAARIEHLERLIEFVAGHAETAGFTVNRINEIELAAEEVWSTSFNMPIPGPMVMLSLSAGARMMLG
jgi:hypothetical protein